MKLTGGEIVARALKEYGITYLAGIPGHGNWSLLDAFLQEGGKIPFVLVMHEQSAIHMADGHFRASGKPMACTTSVGPGATNTVIGLATCYADSTAAFYINGGPATHMKGHGVMQELERRNENAFPHIIEQVTKRSYKPMRVDEIPFVMHRAFNTMLSGRPGPVHVELPMDLQCETADVTIHPLDKRMAVGVSYPDPRAIDRAVELLLSAERPVICAGGGAILSGACEVLTALAEKIGAAVSFTWNGKGAIREDHELCVGAVGQTGTSCGNSITASADVVMSVGCRFTDWSASSYRKGASFSIPPGKLIHIDLDHHEIGKNYPTEVGIVADARVTLEAMVESITDLQSSKALARRETFFADIASAKAEWEAMLAPRRDSTETPFTSQRPLQVLREVMDREGIVTVGSDNTQGAVKQAFPVYEPRTHLTSDSFSPMGWAVPTAISTISARITSSASGRCIRARRAIQRNPTAKRCSSSPTPWPGCSAPCLRADSTSGPMTLRPRRRPGSSRTATRWISATRLTVEADTLRPSRASRTSPTLRVLRPSTKPARMARSISGARLA